MRSRFLLGVRSCALSAVVAIGMSPTSASAIEGNADVSVTQVLKTSHTWSGAPIKYPRGAAETGPGSPVIGIAAGVPPEQGACFICELTRKRALDLDESIPHELIDVCSSQVAHWF